MQIGDKILVKTQVNTGKPKYDMEAKILSKDECGNITFETDDTKAISSRHEDHVRKDTRVKKNQNTTLTNNES